MQDLTAFLETHAVTEVECLVPDMAGIARGKILPKDKFLRVFDNRGLRIPEAVFVQTVTGDFPEHEDVSGEADGDVFLVPDPATVRLVPWAKEPTALVICDVVYADGLPVDFASRAVLRQVVERYRQAGLRPLVAPELEFYLVEVNTNPDLPLKPPIGRSGRKEVGRQAYGIDAANEFDPIFEDIYDYCEAQRIWVDTLAHESGAGQMEINFDPGDALELADQAFLFKRVAREAALRHKVYATFMAKPMQHEPGSAMHLHISLHDGEGGGNVFADANGADTPRFRQFIAGLQHYLPLAMPLVAPNVNSYRRLARAEYHQLNVEWGLDNRTTGLRVPVSEQANRRVENRITGADANPYLAVAASLACGWLGMEQGLEPSPPVRGSAAERPTTLPHHQIDAVRRFEETEALHALLGPRFARALTAVKQEEYRAYQAVISSWERENLLLNV